MWGLHYFVRRPLTSIVFPCGHRTALLLTDGGTGQAAGALSTQGEGRWAPRDTGLSLCAGGTTSSPMAVLLCFMPRSWMPPTQRLSCLLLLEQRGSISWLWGWKKGLGALNSVSLEFDDSVSSTPLTSLPQETQVPLVLKLPHGPGYHCWLLRAPLTWRHPFPCALSASVAGTCLSSSSRGASTPPASCQLPLLSIVLAVGVFPLQCD